MDSVLRNRKQSNNANTSDGPNFHFYDEILDDGSFVSATIVMLDISCSQSSGF